MNQNSQPHKSIKTLYFNNLSLAIILISKDDILSNLQQFNYGGKNLSSPRRVF